MFSYVEHNWFLFTSFQLNLFIRTLKHISQRFLEDVQWMLKIKRFRGDINWFEWIMLQYVLPDGYGWNVKTLMKLNNKRFYPASASCRICCIYDLLTKLCFNFFIGRLTKSFTSESRLSLKFRYSFSLPTPAELELLLSYNM